MEPWRKLALVSSTCALADDVARARVLQRHPAASAEELRLHLLVDGHSYKTAVPAPSLRLDTLRLHMRRVYRKLHVHSKSEAVIAALRRRIVR